MSFVFSRVLVLVSHIKQKRNVKKKIPKVEKREKVKESLIDEKCDWNGSMFPFRGTKELYEEIQKEESDYDDEEWSVDTSKTVTVDINNALGTLMGAYMSDDDNDDEAPVEEKIQRQQVEYPSEEVKETKVKTNKRKLRSDKKQNKIPKLDDNKTVQSAFNRMKFFKRRVSLLEKLLDSEIRHERNVLLQCVQYVVSNNFFRKDNL